MKKNPLMKYSEELAVEIEIMCKSLEKKDNSNAIFQIRKSSSSVYANISEAQFPQSLADMLSKFKIARKECVETESWLKLLFSSNAINEETFKKYRNLCGRIQRMLTSSCVTIENKITTAKENMKSDLLKYNFNIRVTGVLIEDNKILLVKQKVNEKRKWSLPGGKLEQGETLEQGIIREMKEETGLDTEIVKFLYLCDVASTQNTLLHITFLLKRVDGDITLPSNEYENNPIFDVSFVAVDDLKLYGFSEKFVALIKNDFMDAGKYAKDKINIGL